MPTIGFLPLLGLLFIGLKLGGVIAWSWFWVTLPLWAGLFVALAIFGVIAVITTLAGISIKATTHRR
jgi:hypothetical protein